MDNKIILAVAGAGKTYSICSMLQKNYRSLILTYTNENVSNIVNELTKQGKYDDSKIKIMTFDSFKYRYILKAYEPLIIGAYSHTELCDKITIKAPPKQWVNGEYNPLYVKKDKIGHYKSKFGYYCVKFSELIIESDKKTPFLTTAIKNINELVDAIYIDEFQDFVGYDFELIMKLYEQFKTCIFVGDYYQHSVKSSEQKQNNNGKKTIYENYKTKKDFIRYLTTNNMIIDEKSLSASRRCCHDVCKFVNDKLNIPILSQEINTGRVIFVNESEVRSILNDDKIIKLVYRDSAKYTFRSINWAYSKGGTYQSICVILTSKFETIDHSDFNINKIKSTPLIINSLYVALTRSSGNVYILKESIFKKHKNNYQ